MSRIGPRPPSTSRTPKTKTPAKSEKTKPTKPGKPTKPSKPAGKGKTDSWTPKNKPGRPLE